MILLSARQAIHDAYAVHLTGKSYAIDPQEFWESNQGKNPNINQQICNAVEAGMIISTVEGLDEPYKSWAKWAYAPRTEHHLPDQGRFFEWLDRDVRQNLESIERKYREVTKEKIRDVVAYAVLDYRAFVINEIHLYPVSLIINRCNIQRQNWKRDFEPWHEYYWQFCDQQLDRMALVPVANSVQRLKYGKEQTD
ncbi:hypothetical protein [Endozoicomonas atrinae]|uniref:hypothetical protein n=1 Tax=Endozoicomonas atrinae TaxID=1333660 RepID=UPI003B0047EB